MKEKTGSGEFWDLAIPEAKDALPDVSITFQNPNLNVIYDSHTLFENAISGEGLSLSLQLHQTFN